jgi:hypothetical protein
MIQGACGVLQREWICCMIDILICLCL